MKRIYIQRGGCTFKEALSCKNAILVFIVNLVGLKSNSHIKYIYSLSVEFMDYLKSKGKPQKLNVHHTPQHAGVAEH